MEYKGSGRAAGVGWLPAAVLFVAALLLGGNMSYGQETGLRTNGLHWATLTPNAGIEMRLAPQWTATLDAGYQPWKLGGNAGLRHWLVEGEGRYWPCRSFEGTFYGLHGLYGKYYVGSLGLVPALKDNIYTGSLYGLGAGYGYHWSLGGRWGLEAEIGVGWLHTDFQRYLCLECREKAGRGSRDWFAPTRVGITIIYMLK